jgi:hypothetical protein
MAETVLTDPVMAPGVYDDVPAEAYHADPALSSTGARQLLPPSCPARFRWDQLYGQPPKAVFDFGQAAHLAALGAGPDLVIVEAPDWRTKRAQQLRDGARAEGAVPLLEHQYEQVQAMAAALRAHPVAGPVFAPGSGRGEVSLWWADRPTGVMRRARLDWLREPVAERRLIVPDYKTCRSASPEAFRKATAEYGYHQQADWYTAAVQALGLAPGGAAFVFICQEKDPPYLVATYELDAVALRIGAAKNRAALETFAECTATGRWPGYGDEPQLISLPPWAEIRDTEEYL